MWKYQRYENKNLSFELKVRSRVFKQVYMNGETLHLSLLIIYIFTQVLTKTWLLLNKVTAGGVTFDLHRKWWWNKSRWRTSNPESFNRFDTFRIQRWTEEEVTVWFHHLLQRGPRQVCSSAPGPVGLQVPPTGTDSQIVVILLSIIKISFMSNFWNVLKSWFVRSSK